MEGGSFYPAVSTHLTLYIYALVLSRGEKQRAAGSKGECLDQEEQSWLCACVCARACVCVVSGDLPGTMSAEGASGKQSRHRTHTIPVATQRRLGLRQLRALVTSCSCADKTPPVPHTQPTSHLGDKALLGALTDAIQYPFHARSGRGKRVSSDPAPLAGSGQPSPRP